MTTPRSYTFDATKPTYLRAGIKWDPLERDNIDEHHVIGSAKDARAKLDVLSNQLKMLSLAASFFRMTILFKGLADILNKEHHRKTIEQKALTKYLMQEKLVSYDLDLCCFCYGQDEKLVGFVMPDYTEMHGMAQFHPAFLHSGNDMTGTGDAFDEELLVNLHGIDEAIHQIFVIVISNKHGFDQVKSGFWSIVSTKNEKEIMSARLKTKAQHKAHIMAKMVRNGTSWVVTEIAEYSPLDNDKNVPVSSRIDRLLAARYFANGNGGNDSN